MESLGGEPTWAHIPYDATRLKSAHEKLEKQPENLDAKLELAQGLANTGDVTGALTIIRKVLQHNSDNTQVLTLSTAVFLLAGLSEEVIELLHRAIALYPDDPSVHYCLGLTYNGASQRNKARQEWEIVKQKYIGSLADKNLTTLEMSPAKSSLFLATHMLNTYPEEQPT